MCGRLGEHVHRLHPLQPVALAHQVADVAGQRGRDCTRRRRCGPAPAPPARSAPWDESRRAADRRPPPTARTPSRDERRAARAAPRRPGRCSCRCRWRARCGWRRPPRPPTARCRRRGGPAGQQQADGAGARVEVDAPSRCRRARTPRPPARTAARPARCSSGRTSWPTPGSRTPPSDSVMWSRPSSRCSSLPTATLAFLAFTFSTHAGRRRARARAAPRPPASAPPRRARRPRR